MCASMCFHLSLNREIYSLEKRFQANFREPEKYRPAYYVAAHSNPEHPVITNDKPENIQFLGWGLIPHWMKDNLKAAKIRANTYNARSDTIFDKPSFRNSIRQKRCLVLADGFFEWQEVRSKNYPYYIKLKNNNPFAFAGIWDTAILNGIPIETFSVITTEANPLMARIHNKKKRMPVILQSHEEKLWLKNGLCVNEIISFMQPFNENEMEAHTISHLVTSRTQERNVPAVIKPYQYVELINTQNAIF